jgi:glycosyltransferase involved in cell wall biosynthesis
VIFCGVLDYPPNESGVLWFLDAVWPGVHAAHPGARFRIVGARPTDRLRRAARRQPSVELVGPVAAVQPFLWESAVAVAPIHVARGVQNKVLEALAAGLPVVATPIVLDGLPAPARPGCIGADDAGGFARTVVRLLKATPASRAEQVARARMDRLSWEERLSSLRGILEAALSGPVARVSAELSSA